MTNINKTYGGLQALSEVSFDVRQGEILGIVGPNGAGKSTLIDIVTGVQAPDSGKVVLDGNEMTRGPAFRAHRGMSRTFQHPLLAQHLTVLDNVRLGYLREKAPRSWVGLFVWFLRNMVIGQRGESREVTNEGARIEHEFTLLAKFLHSSGHRRIPRNGEAGGKRARPHIFAAPAHNGRTLRGSRPIVDRCHRPNSQALELQGLAAVIVDHNVDVLRDMCDRMVVLNYGQVIAVGKPRDVLEDQVVRRAYFGDE